VLLGFSPGRTDTAGRVTFEDLAPGSYRLSLLTSSGHFLSEAVQLEPGRTEFRFVLPRTRAGFRVQSVGPALNADDVRLATLISLSFTQAPDPASVQAADFSFSPDIGPFSVNVTADEILLRPLRQLPPGQTIVITLSGQLRAVDGTVLDVPVRSRFRTAETDTEPPALVGQFPTDGAGSFPLNRPLRFEFNEPLDSDVRALELFSDPPAELSVQISGSTILVAPVGQWNPDGDYFVSVSNVSDTLGNIRRDPYGIAFLTGTSVAPFRNQNPEWNRALNVIVFASDRLGTFDIYSVAPDGTALTLLAAQPGDEFEPTVSSDGDLLAWQARGPGGDWDVFVSNRAAPQLAQPVTPVGADDTQPVFSRGFTRDLLLVSDRLGERLIHRMGPDGSGFAPLAPDISGQQYDPAPHPLIDNQLLFTSGRSGSEDVWSMSVSVLDGEVTVLNVTDNLVTAENQPAWVAEADGLLYMSDLGGGRNLWRSDFAGLERQLTDFDTALSEPQASPLSGDNRAVAVLADANGGSDLVIIDTISGALVTNLTEDDD
jgi:hypothetical protein